GDTAAANANFQWFFSGHLVGLRAELWSRAKTQDLQRDCFRTFFLGGFASSECRILLGVVLHGPCLIWIRPPRIPNWKARSKRVEREPRNTSKYAKTGKRKMAVRVFRVFRG